MIATAPIDSEITIAKIGYEFPSGREMFGMTESTPKTSTAATASARRRSARLDGASPRSTMAIIEQVHRTPAKSKSLAPSATVTVRGSLKSPGRTL